MVIMVCILKFVQPLCVVIYRRYYVLQYRSKNFILVKMKKKGSPFIICNFNYKDIVFQNLSSLNEKSHSSSVHFCRFFVPIIAYEPFSFSAYADVSLLYIIPRNIFVFLLNFA